MCVIEYNVCTSYLQPLLIVSVREYHLNKDTYKEDVMAEH